MPHFIDCKDKQPVNIDLVFKISVGEHQGKESKLYHIVFTSQDGEEVWWDFDYKEDRNEILSQIRDSRFFEHLMKRGA